MAQYRLTADHYIGNQYLEAGSIVSDGPQGVLPSTWVPTLACEPIDSDGLQKFFNAGPTQAMGSAEHGSLSVVFCGNRWSGIPVAPSSRYWKPVIMNGVKVW